MAYFCHQQNRNNYTPGIKFMLEMSEKSLCQHKDDFIMIVTKSSSIKTEIDNREKTY